MYSFTFNPSWKFNIEFFPDWQQFSFCFRRNTVMRQNFYLALATISYALVCEKEISYMGKTTEILIWCARK